MCLDNAPLMCLWLFKFSEFILKPILDSVQPESSGHKTPPEDIYMGDICGRQLGSLLQVRVLNYCQHFARSEINKRSRSRLAFDCLPPRWRIFLFLAIGSVSFARSLPRKIDERVNMCLCAFIYGFP